jgi:hypothetical protein
MRTSHDLPYRQDLPEVCTLSGWVFPGWRPYPGDYSRAFASSGILYPLRHPRSLRSGYQGLALGRVGLTTFRSIDAVMPVEAPYPPAVRRTTRW